eukprot:3269322-Rhodomonas_salina.1
MRVGRCIASAVGWREAGVAKHALPQPENTKLKSSGSSTTDRGRGRGRGTQPTQQQHQQHKQDQQHHPPTHQAQQHPTPGVEGRALALPDKDFLPAVEDEAEGGVEDACVELAA